MKQILSIAFALALAGALLTGCDRDASKSAGSGATSSGSATGSSSGSAGSGSTTGSAGSSSQQQKKGATSPSPSTPPGK